MNTYALQYLSIFSYNGLKSFIVDSVVNQSGTKRIQLFQIMSIPTTFRLFLVLTSEQIGRRLPVFTLLL